jgi:hypothetical protein
MESPGVGEKGLSCIDFSVVIICLNFGFICTQYWTHYFAQIVVGADRWTAVRSLIVKNLWHAEKQQKSVY